ncbi:hypothetical protein ACH5RR_032371 [Cinchona calisaya]|uniref:Protein FAR1-RELATED SEQUENCE n=1 Tax=Cinchona calisaya TaxID=153742 RepID=A0ABD2YKH2_9GENT
MVGVKTSQIIKHFVLQFGGCQNVGFILKDLYNKMDIEMKREIEMGDVEAAIGYLATKMNADKMFYYKYDTNEKGRLHRLFWTDSWPRYDYNRFLDFDTIY